MREIPAVNLVDGYKTGHFAQYPEGTEMVYSNWTARGSRIEGVTHTVLFGLQYFCLAYLNDWYKANFFSIYEDEAVNKFQSTLKNYLGTDVNVNHIRELHRYGKMPLEIRALPEGSLVPIGVPMITIANTQPQFYWVTNMVETLFSTTLWPMCTVATLAYRNRRLLEKYGQKTGADPFFVSLQAHDFSMRGMFGLEAGLMSGAAHLLSGVGTDCLPAIDFLEEYYGADSTKEMVGISVPATEHSVMCMGSKEGERETIRRLMNETYPTGILAVVCDTWDFWKVVSETLPSLKDEIMARDGKLVIRPDSGNPADILCGQATKAVTDPDGNEYDFETWKAIVADDMDRIFCRNLVAEDPHYEETTDWRYGDKYYRVTYAPDLNRHDKTYYYVDNWGSTVSRCEFVEVERTAEDKGLIESLWDTFGGTVNDKGYKVLDSHIGAIYGDSITHDVMEDTLSRLEAKGFASDNVVFGVGSFSYQHNTRDTFNFAVKATAGFINGEPVEIFKDPATGNGSKKSAKGFIKIVRGEDGDYQAEYPVSYGDSLDGEMRLMYKEGQIDETTLVAIRKRLHPDWNL